VKVECNINNGSGPFSSVYETNEQSRYAFSDFYNENYSAAYAGFQPIADLDRGTYNATTCVYKINFARCIVHAFGDIGGSGKGRDDSWYDGVTKELTGTDDPVLISPNPATNNLQLLSPAGERCSIHVIDLLGKNIYSNSFTNSFTNSHKLDVNRWQNGLYLFIISNEQGEQVQISKVSIQ